MYRDPKEVHEAAQRAIALLEPHGFDSQRDVLLVYAAYCDAQRTLRCAGIVEAPLDTHALQIDTLGEEFP